MKHEKAVLRALIMGFMFLILAVRVVMAGTPERENDHEQLRALRISVVKALNEKDAVALKPLLHKNFVFTTVDATVIRTMEDFESYLQTLFNSEDSDLKDMEFNPISNGPTEFISENVGINFGTSIDKYVFKNGNTKEMISNWTATIIKEQDVWKVASIHMSVNVLDNPVLDIYKNKSIVNFFLQVFKGKNK